MTRLRRLLLALGFVIAGLLFPAAATVGASGLEEPTPIGPDAVQVDGALNLPPFVVSAILGIAIPVLTGLLTKLTTAAWVKYAITSVLSAIAGLINVSLVDGGGAVISWSAVSAALTTWVLALAAYQGWQSLGVTSSPVTTVDASGTVTTVPGKLATVGVK